MNMSYYIESYARGEYEEKKSRFIGEIFPVRTQAEAEETLAGVRKKYYDARHHCYAYVLGKNYETVKQSDDGEPSRTAGTPILSVLQGEGIHDALLVVTRYFGGTLLGTGGLVRSYTNAAKDALNHAVLLHRVDGFRASAEVDYSLVGKLKRLAEKYSLKEEEGEYSLKASLTWLVPGDILPSFRKDFTELVKGCTELAIEEAEWYTNTV